MVTASHNPAPDNGFKVFAASGSQIVPPVDAGIASRMAALDPCAIELADADSPLVERCGEEAVASYLQWLTSVRSDPSVPPLRVAYSALCGVAGETLCRAFAEVGFPAPAVVASQQDPDGSFPGLPFPNPEEAGVMDEVVALAAREGLPLALANDPDGDRLGVAIPTRSGRWRRLSGDEIGWVLAEYLLERTSGPDRLVATTVVSSTLLGRIAERHGVVFEETFTGFKWLADRALGRPDLRLVFAYEQALGFLVASRPLDKDGISAAIVLVEAASAAARDGLTIEDLLDRIAARYGKVFTFEQSVPLGASSAAALVARLVASPPARLGAFTLERVEDLSAAGLVRLFFEAGGARVRVSVRPSGTEPKVKFYGELTCPPPADERLGGSGISSEAAAAVPVVHPGGEPDAALLEGLVRWFVASSESEGVRGVA
jgi:phosphomannomutase